ncbi:bifunctional diguanylate cyclase/phosphodiesterase [Halorhodospira sp. 9622]|uniref:putative bifunctional diguanylate cyclase/phosphodiesterase n=1 Tax=Halorhodospira sp. 9622 TaxID=2899136 RepID=UPI001EE88518|nr:EAL domain-containing protein [Halorhodospira sp. 9622]MCG5539440.1 EAL domain-containing protein [Halorhodospira sp. 9622]
MDQSNLQLKDLLDDPEGAHLLLRVVDALTLDPDLEQFFPHAAEVARDIVGACGAALILFNERGNLEYQFFHGEHALRLSRFSGYSFSMDRGTAGMALRERRPIYEPDYANSPYALSDFKQAGLCANLALPLITDSQLLGALVLSWFRPPQAPLGERDQYLAQKVANQIAVATHRHVLEQRLHEQALVDDLTGLYNRKGILDRLASKLAHHERQHRTFALIMVDMDRFKAVNDQYGHNLGDQMLRDCAERMRNVCRRHDDIGRLGGDEFVILADTNHPEEPLEPLLRRLAEALSLPIIAAGAKPTPSIGAVRCPQDGDSGEALLRRCDLAVYEAKTCEGASFQFFQAEQEERIRDQERTAHGVLEAMESGRLHLYYQPIVRPDSGDVVAYEALVRWDHEDQGLLTAGQFMPQLERQGKGMVGMMDRWVLNTATGQFSEILSQSAPEVRLQVNMSAIHFTSPQFPDELEAILTRYPTVEPERLVIEITETAMVANFDAAAANIAACHELGVRVALDDFGAGFASLGYIKRMAVDILKVDGSFTIGLFEDPSNEAILRGIQALGHAMGLEVIAEGVETTGHASALSQIHFDGLQGFGLGQPAPRKEVTRSLAL